MLRKQWQSLLPPSSFLCLDLIKESTASKKLKISVRNYFGLILLFLGPGMVAAYSFLWTQSVRLGPFGGRDALGKRGRSWRGVAPSRISTRSVSSSSRGVDTWRLLDLPGGTIECGVPSENSDGGGESFQYNCRFSPASGFTRLALA